MMRACQPPASAGWSWRRSRKDPGWGSGADPPNVFSSNLVEQALRRDPGQGRPVARGGRPEQHSRARPPCDRQAAHSSPSSASCASCSALSLVRLLLVLLSHTPSFTACSWPSTATVSTWPLGTAREPVRALYRAQGRNAPLEGPRTALAGFGGCLLLRR